ncbi:MAG: DUF4340 domain-containing protein [Deltaproteobacteria bacterium]|nr:DUF4340 domain-containing protein [Deltaproteobacteria bacterium]
MKQAHKTLLSMVVFVVAALGLGLLAVHVGKDEEAKTEAKEKAQKLFEIDKAKAREVRVTKAGALVAALKREAQDKPWRVVEPVQVDADDATTAAIVDKLSELKQKAEVEGLDGKGVGLADEKAAKLVVTVVEEGGKASTLWFGEENPFDHSLYVRKAGEALVRQINAGDKAPFDKTLFDLRDKSVAHLTPQAEVTELSVTPPVALKGALVSGTFGYAAKKEGTAWSLTAPEPGAADGSGIERVIQLVKNLKGTAVASETATEAQLKEYGLNVPKWTVQLTVTSGKDSFKRTVLVGQPGPTAGSITVKTYAKRDDSPVVFAVDNSVVKDLGKDLFELQAKNVFPVLDREAVRTLVYETPDKPAVRIARKKESLADGGPGEETFTLLAPTPGPTKKYKVAGNLTSILSLRAAAFAGPAAKSDTERAKFGLEPKKARVLTLLGDKDAVLAKLWVGAEHEAHVYVQAEGGQKVVEVDRGIVNDWTWAADAAAEPPAPAAASTSTPAVPPGPIHLPKPGEKVPLPPVLKK